MITGLWKNVRLVCGNPAHSSHEYMFLRETGEDVFYACPKYNPENRDSSEKPCMNRISIAEAEKMLENLSEKIQQEEENHGAFFANNYRFETRIGKYRVMNHSPEDLIIMALNKRSLLK